MVLSSNGKKASSKGKFDKKKASSGIDNAIDLKPMKFDADLTAELIIRIITVYSSSSLQKEKNNNSTVSASSASSSSTCGDAILVFLSGVQAIEKVNRALRQRSIVQSMKVQVDTYCYDISTYLPHLPTSLPHLPTYLPTSAYLLGYICRYTCSTALSLLSNRERSSAALLPVSRTVRTARS